MPRFLKQRTRHKSRKFSEMGRKSQAVQAARRLAEREAEPDDPPLSEGEAVGMIEYRCLRTGRIHRWVLCRGNRINNFRLRTPDGRQSKPHELAWVLDKIRPVLLGHRAPTTRPNSV